MRRKLLVILLLLLTLSLCACNLNFGNTPPVDEGEKENLIFNSTSELYFIAGEGVEGNPVDELISSIDNIREVGNIVNFASPDSELHTHEIVLGSTEREISKTALMRLERIDKNTDDDLRYVIYSDGSSVAIVYDFDSDGVALYTVIKLFIEKYVKSELVLAPGEVEKGTVNVIDHYTEIDKQTREQYKTALIDKVGGETGQKLAAAMEQFYSLYSNDMVTWLANLYEPSICVCNGYYGESECQNTKYCGTGAFYYSNSARDNIGYLPDVESTFQALGLLNSTGITKNYGSSWKAMLPEEINDNILAFVKSIQREDGFFVHPQWQSPGNSRISRDLNWSVSLLKTFDARPYYSTPDGSLKGTGAPSASSSLSGKLYGRSTVTATGAALASESYLSHLESVETFKTYLNGLNVKVNSYSAGNTLSAQAAQIRARDKALGLTGENSLYGTMIAHLDGAQNPENGTWDYKKEGDADYDLYFQVNGLMKISGVYGSTYPINYLDKAVETAIKAITYDKSITAAVDIYNPWFALTNIFINIGGCGDRSMITELRQRLYETAPETLVATRDKISKCKKNDGSFSYGTKYSSATSQGCPAAVPNSIEGDINGTVLSCSGLIDYVYSALGLSGSTKIPLFGEVERLIFMREIGSLQHMDKPNTSATVSVEDFESDIAGEAPEGTYIKHKVYNTDGKINVLKREDGQGNALYIDSRTYDGYGDYVYVTNQSKSPALSNFVFEGDFKVDYASKSYAVQIIMGSAYMFTLRVNNGTVRIYECSSSTQNQSLDNNLGVSVPLGEWFSIRAEYYYGKHDEVRIKFYFDGDLTDGKNPELIAVTDNYYDKAGGKTNNPTGTPSNGFGETQIYVLSDAEAKLWVDNLASYKISTSYTPEPDKELKFNVDARDKASVSHGFEDGAIPSDITVNGEGFAVTEKDGNKLLTHSAIGGGSTLSIPVNLVRASGKCTEIYMKVFCESASSGGTVMTVDLSGEFGKVIGLALVAETVGNEKQLNVCEYYGEVGAKIEGAKIPIGSLAELKIEYYSDYRVAIVYIDGEFVGASSTLYKNGNRRSATNVTLDFKQGDHLLSLDELKVERNSSAYADAVKPEGESNVRDFEDGTDSDILLKNVTVVSVAEGGKAAKLDSGRSESFVKIPVHNRSKIPSALKAELEIAYSKATVDGKTHTIALTDSEGGIIFGLLLSVKGESAELYELNRSAEAKMLLATFKKEDVNKIGFDVFVDKKLAFVYINDECIAKTGSFAYPENIENEAAYLEIKSSDAKSELLVDNVIFESLYTVFENKKPNALPNFETEGTLTFDKSNSGSLPSRLHSILVGSASSVRVENTLNGVSGEYSNAFVLNTKAGNNTNDKVGLKTGASEDLSSYSCVTFETDFRIDSFSSNREKFWFYLSKDAEATSDVIYQLCIEASGGKIVVFDRSDAVRTNRYSTNISLDGWHHMKLEYYAGDSESARIRLFIDDTLIFVSNNYAGRTASGSTASRTGIKRAYFYAFNDTDCDLYLDNMSLTGSDATCSDELTKK